jgi:thiol-disulfide isomerase/thioredoxin
MKGEKLLWFSVFLLFASNTVNAEHLPENETDIVVYFFWSKGCPHCATEMPFLQELETQYPWLNVLYLEVSESENSRLFAKMADECGEVARGVPATFICGDMMIGYRSDETTGEKIKSKIQDCYWMSEANRSAKKCVVENASEVTVDIPFMGEVDSSDMSLPVFTVMLGGLDGFNPCAFFVLFFLLSLLIHARSRFRMLLIGGIFVFFSGFIYFLFMAAWLNFFLVIGQRDFITTIAGIIALIVAFLNIKDFIWFKRGVSLSIPESAKPKLFTRMRNLVKATELPSMVLGTVILAIAANTYELLCTAGFPLVYTRVLTLSNLSTLQYYMYLALYNVVYVLPLLSIVLMFTLTLGSRKLKEREGRVLKLMSGFMMLGLGLILVLAPELLSDLYTAASILLLAVGLTVVFMPFARKKEGA